MSNQEDFKISTPELRSESEITPEHSDETSEIVERFNSGMQDSENLLGGLDKLAREQIITDPKAFEDIYARKEVGKMDLKGEYDAFAFESAGIGLEVRSAIRRVVSLGLAGYSKYALKEDSWGLADKRKVEEGAKGKRFALSPDELTEAAQKFGLNPEEIRPEDFSKTYVEGKKGAQAEKIILKNKTGQELEQEMNETAGKILEGRLKELETKNGADLIKQKDGLEVFKKEKEQHKDILDEESMAKLNREEADRQEIINEKQKMLESDLEVIRSPLLERQKDLSETLEGFSALLAGVTGRGKSYEEEVKSLQVKISKINSAKQIREVLGDKVKEWEEQKAQAEANLKNFGEKKDAINMRIVALKKDKAEVDKTLARINKIGKTREELKAEEAEKRQEEKEKQKKAAEEKPAKEPVKAGGVLYDEDAAKDEEVKQWEETRDKGREIYQDLGAEIDEERKTATVTEKKTKKNKAAKKPAGPKIEINPAASPAGNKQEKSEEPLSMSSREWVAFLPQILNLKLSDGQKDKIKNYFLNVNSVYSPAVIISEKQAIANMSNFLKSEIYKKGKKTKDQIEQELTDKIKSHKKINK